MSNSKRYRYFDTPEGEDTLKKLWFVLKPALYTGIVFSTIDVMCYAHPRTYLQIVGRYAYITLPIIGMATAFVVTTNLAVNLRNKDDKVNWVIGSLAAGSIFGTWRRSVLAGCLSSAAFSFAAIIKKHTVQEGWRLLPEEKSIVSFEGLHHSRQDWTLMKERPRGWTSVAPTVDEPTVE